MQLCDEEGQHDLSVLMLDRAGLEREKKKYLKQLDAR